MNNRHRQSAFDLFDDICRATRTISTDVLEEVLTLAVEIAREGPEGHSVGTMFVLSNEEEEVLRRSRALILDPLYGHPDQVKQIDSSEMRETLKKLAQLDGAFVVSNVGIVISGARYIESSVDDIDLPRGLGTRHLAGASISRHTDTVSVVVSQSSIVRVFDDGELISEILPELWLLRENYPTLLTGEIEKQTHQGTTVLRKCG